MSFMSRLFGTTRAPAPVSRPPSQLASGYSQQTSGAPASSSATRRELLRVVLRDTLNRHGIPAAWLSAEVLASTSRSGERGIHWRLVVKHWEPRLMIHGVAFQQSLIKRVTTFDPLAANWLMGISWQFALPDESVCPAMPHPGLWTGEPTVAAPKASTTAGGSGDVIAGPVTIRDPAAPANPPLADAKSDLEHLFAVRDADFRQHAKAEPGHEATQPMYLGTQPAQL